LKVCVGWAEGVRVGRAVGNGVGKGVGWEVGSGDGCIVGNGVGSRLGTGVGRVEGLALGAGDGENVTVGAGDGVGTQPTAASTTATPPPAGTSTSCRGSLAPLKPTSTNASKGERPSIRVAPKRLPTDAVCAPEVTFPFAMIATRAPSGMEARRATISELAAELAATSNVRRSTTL
jgi:hypothetical protein